MWVKCGYLNVKLDGILTVSQSRILERLTRTVACRVGSGGGTSEGAIACRMFAAVASAAGGVGRILEEPKNLGLTTKICSNLLEDMPIPLLLYPSQLVHSQLQESIRKKFPLWTFGPQPPKTTIPVTFLLLGQPWAITGVHYLCLPLACYGTLQKNCKQTRV